MRRTHAFEMIEQIVCSASRRVYGNASHEFLLEVCRLRQSPGLLSGPGSSTASWGGAGDALDICSALRLAKHQSLLDAADAAEGAGEVTTSEVAGGLGGGEGGGDDIGALGQEGPF